MEEAAVGRRWLIVGALFVITYCMATPLASYGVFLPILAERFGWSRGAISAALSMSLLVGGVAGFAAGALADRYGPRLILVVTVTLAGAARPHLRGRRSGSSISSWGSWAVRHVELLPAERDDDRAVV
jgi:MFS family permease